MIGGHFNIAELIVTEMITVLSWRKEVAQFVGNWLYRRSIMFFDQQTASSHFSLPQRPLLHHFLDWQCLILQGALTNGVPLRPRAALEKQSRLIGLFLDRAPEGVILTRPFATERRLADIDDYDVAAEVHHLTAGDKGGVVAPRHLACREKCGKEKKRELWEVENTEAQVW